MQVIKALILFFLTINSLVVLISAKKLPPCDQDQLYKTEYHHRAKDKIYVKLNTTLNCKCGVQYKVSNPKDYVPENETAELYSLRINCTKDETKELANETTCKPNEECKHDIWEDYGEHHPHKFYKDYSKPLCNCDGSRRCIKEREAYLRTIYTCKTLHRERPNKFCGENSVSKVEYHRKQNDDDRLVKTDTFFICRCVVFQNYSEVLGPKKDPKNERNVIVDYKCSNKFHVEYQTLESCITGELCGIDHYNDYGRRRAGKTYFDYFSKKCLCDRFRKCVHRQKTIEGDIHYYCELKNTKPDDLKLQECSKDDIYKEEVLLGTFNTSVPKDLIKMDTLFRCQCDHERMESPLLEQKAYPGRNTLFRTYNCVRNKNRKIKMKYCLDRQHCTGDFEYDVREKMEDCFEYQTCRRDFIYYYGKDRDEKHYVENVKRLCNCPSGLECKPISRLSQYYPTDPYDEVLSYRCMNKRWEKLEPCVKNQTYMVEINRLVNNDYALPVRVNTFLKCICDSADDKMPIIRHTRNDPGYPDIESILTHVCPRIPKSSENDTCRNYGVCRKGFRLPAGLEDPDRNVTHYYTTYCKCEPGFSCDNVGVEGNHTIHRCIKKISSSQMEVCKDDEIFRVHVDLYSYSPSRDVLRDRLNTFQVCKCLQKVKNIGIFEVRNAWLDQNFEWHLIQNYKCPKPKKGSKSKEVLPYCTHQQVCKTQHLENIGREKPDSLIELNSTEHCTCHPPRKCQVTDQCSHQVAVSQCLLDETMKPKLRRCIPGQLYMEEIHQNISMSNGEFRVIKNHTIHKCICEQTLHNPEVEERFEITEDPADEQRFNVSFYCPHHVSIAEEAESCSDYAICKIDIYTDYGLNLGPHAKYLKHSYPYCECDRDRTCEISEKGYPSWALTTYDTYRCKEKVNEQELEPCSENQDFLVVVRSLNSSAPNGGKLNTFLKCFCNHDQDSYKNLPSTSVIDSSHRDQLITTYKCSLSRKPVEKKSCKELDVCLVERHDDYGRERSGEYVFRSNRLCTCGLLEECSTKEKRDRISSYRCAPKVCRENEDCRIVTYSVYSSASKIPEKNETLCHCSGNCNIRPIGSTFVSNTYGNATVHYSCMLKSDVKSDKNYAILSRPLLED